MSEPLNSRTTWQALQRFVVLGIGSNLVFALVYHLLGLLHSPSGMAYVCGYGISLLFNVTLSFLWVFKQPVTAPRFGGMLAYHAVVGLLGGVVVHAIRDSTGWGHWAAVLPVLAVTIPLNFIVGRWIAGSPAPALKS